MIKIVQAVFHSLISVFGKAGYTSNTYLENRWFKLKVDFPWRSF